MTDRPKLHVKPDHATRDPRRKPVRPTSAPRPPAKAAGAGGSAAPSRGERPAPSRSERPAPSRAERPPPARNQRPPASPARAPRATTEPTRGPPPAAPRRARPEPAAPPGRSAKRPDPRAAASPAAAPRRPAPPTPRADGDGVRISKLLTERGLASRREADDWIAAGFVRVRGRMATLGQRVAPDEPIEIDPRAREAQARLVTVLLHKPIGFVSGQPEDNHPPAITLITPGTRWGGDMVRVPLHAGQLRGLAPAGRLDIDSTGLLVLTQDGRIAKLLIGEDSRVEKEYLVRVAPGPGAKLPDTDLERLRHGLELDGKPLKPAKVSWANEDQLRFVLREGRKRQIRRMCELVGLRVLALKRVRIGSVTLGALPMGQWRLLGPNERFG